ncbi:MAG: hypothetical protein HFI61_06500 [Lachnospiraceae bacterium]|nr:hypothetical protein [Lachnospiraceae bacterium]
MITGKRMGKKVMAALLAAALVCGMTGCGKAESASGEATGGDAVDFSGLSGGGDSVDLSEASESDDTAALMGAPEEAGSEGRQAVDEDFVIVKMPQISYDDFGNGFYDEYRVLPLDLEAKEAGGPEVSCDEDGLLTDVKISLQNEQGEIAESWLTMEYEKKDGFVTACKISADVAAFLVSEYEITESEASQTNEYLMGKMPMEFVFDSPMEPDPEAVIEAVHDKLIWSGGLTYGDYIFPIAFHDLCNIYLEKLSSGEMDLEDGQEQVSYVCDEDGLLTSVEGSFTAGSGEDFELWFTLEYEKEDGLVTGCEISADLYSFFIHELGFDEETAKACNDELTDKMPVRLVFDEPTEASETVYELTAVKLEEAAESEAEYGLLEAFCYIGELYLAKLYSGDTSDIEGAGDVGYIVNVGHGTQKFEGRMKGNDLAVNVIVGGELTGEKKISNDPGWSIDMSVSHEDVICQIETEQDSDGNLALVHLYNDYASYDYVYTYDNAGRMTRYDYYEYPKGQSREAVGARWYTEYSYDGEGRLIKRHEISNQDNGVESATEYYYDDMGRVAARVDTARYFGNDYMTMQQIYDSVSQTYDYDDSGKVGSVTITVDWAQTVLQPDPVEPTTVLYVPK